MRKYIIGGLVGAALTFSVTAYGEDLSKIGAKVQGEYTVVVDGATLPQKAVGIDGTTYAPLRAIGEELGYSVSFADGTVTYTEKEASNPVSTTTNETSSSGVAQTGSEYTKEQIGGGISKAENNIKIWSRYVQNMEANGDTGPDYENAKKVVQDEQANLEFWQNEKAKYDAAQAAAQAGQ